MSNPTKIKFLFFSISIILTSVNLIAQEAFVKVNPGAIITNQADQLLKAVDHYQIDILEVEKKLNTAGKIEFDIPVGDRIKTIALEKINILTPDYKLFTGSGKTLNTANKYAFYHGTIKGKSNSKVTMIIYGDNLSVSIFDGDGNFEINKEGELYAGYFNHDRRVPIGLDWECKVIDEGNAKSESKNSESRSNTTPECVTVFLELDHNMYNKKGANIANAEAWALTLFSQLAILFIEHNVTVNISGIQVWDVTDPYITATNTSNALSLFRSAVHNNPNFNGRLAHLLSGRSLGGGIAYLNSLCSTSTNVAVSANLSGGSVPYPTYSWNVMVVSHEMGHNMGSNHTQACVWNGNNTAIDGCGAIEGNCPDPGNPPSNIGGTIMSYCHQNVGINFNNGFGPQPGGLIEDKFINASCVTGTNCSYVPPFNDICNRAKELPVLNYCVNGYFGNHATTPSGDGGNMSCGNSGVENDIWYKFEHIDVGMIQVEVAAAGNITDLIVEIYSGDCNALSSLDCGFSSNGEQVSITLNDPALINETLYIRIVEDGSDEEGEFSICIYSAELPCQTQLDTLLNIYQELDGANWTNNTGWIDGFLNGTCAYCNWSGITCNYLGEIIEIDMSNNNLQGKLTEDFAALINLKKLNLNNNLLIDSIPNYWDSLDQLTVLDLSYNSITGSIPLSYTTMDKINTIHLDYNNLDDLIPPGLGYNGSLRTFTASNNQLEGCFSTGISSFCYKDSLNLDNNPDLPYSGDVTLLCEEGWGSDWDLDGFCNEVEDCDDYDVEINPDADEVLCDAKDNNCDGMIDEGSDFGPNVWMGPDTLGIFDDPLNWSLGHVPLICENIEIGMNGDIIDLIILGNSEEGGTGQGDEEGGSNSLQIRDLNIGTNLTLHLLENYSLSILGNGVIVNNGIFNVTGYISIRDQNNTTNTAFVNNGTLNVIGYGGVNINEIGDYGLHNTNTGIIEMNGYSYMESYESEVAKNAIRNEGVLNILGNLNIYGTYTEDGVKNINGGILEVKNGGFLYVY